MHTSDGYMREVELCVELDAVRNTLNSFALLNDVERWQGLHTWVIKTAQQLSEQQRYTNRLLFQGLSAFFFGSAYASDFPAYLDRLVREDAQALRDAYLQQLRVVLTRYVVDTSTDKDSEHLSIPPDHQLLKNEQTYLSCMQYLTGEDAFDRQLHSEVHRLLNDAPALQQAIVSHLTFLWNDTFAAEWKRVQRTLQSWTEMYRYSMEPGWTLHELLSTFTGRHIDDALVAQANTVQQVTIVPSWHCGWHIVSRPSENGLLIFFSEPANYNNAELRKISMGQKELSVRMAALADETRLHIIELLMQRDEWEAQEIIAELDLSQSSVSRHLKQLVSLGYLYERRGEGANKTYRLSSIFFARTARAVESLVSGEQLQPQEQPANTLDQEVKRFVDAHGRLTTWPLARQRDKVIVLEYLASFFRPGQEYSEKEVNETLLAHSRVKDPAALRRAMTEYHFMQRRPNGSAYWLADTVQSE
jgi:hypothetical protein